MKSRIVLALLLASITNLHAQEGTVANFLLTQPSIRANGLGLASVASTHDDPLALSFNPARAGISPNKLYFAGEFYPASLKLFGLDEIKYDAKGLQLGINWHLGQPERWLRFGFGYNRIMLDLGELIITGENSPEPLGTVDLFEKADVFAFSIGLRYGVDVAVGLSTKKIAYQYAGLPDLTELKTTTTANDLGLLLAWPVFETLVKPGGKPLMFGKNLRPSLRPAVGYSKSNIGDELQYFPSTGPDPLPRVARLGVSVNASLTLTDRDEPWQLGAVEWIQEAEDGLVRRGEDGSISYSPFLGKIDLYKNVLLGQGNGEVVIKRGWEFTALELVSYRVGRYADQVRGIAFKTDGWEVRLSGLLKLYLRFKPYARENPFYDFLLRHVDLHYQQASWNANALETETVRGIRVSVF